MRVGTLETRNSAAYKSRRTHMEAMGSMAGIAMATTAYSTRPGQTRRAMVCVIVDICGVAEVGTAVDEDG